jgi:hypothetical protein
MKPDAKPGRKLRSLKMNMMPSFVIGTNGWSRTSGLRLWRPCHARALTGVEMTAARDDPTPIGLQGLWVSIAIALFQRRTL